MCWYDVNHVVIAQGRGNAANLLCKRNKKQIALYRWDKAKATALMNAHGLQLPQSSPAVVHNIYDPESPVKNGFIKQTDVQQFKAGFATVS